MKKNIMILSATIIALAMPLATIAATYAYVNVSGQIETESAINAAQALIQPTDIAAHSGVMLVSSAMPLTVVATSTTGTVVTTTTVVTNSSSTAMTAATSSPMNASSSASMSMTASSSNTELSRTPTSTTSTNTSTYGNPTIL